MLKMLICGAFALGLAACGDEGVSDASSQDGGENNGGAPDSSSNNASQPGPLRYGKPRLCERDSFAESILCGSDADCEERLPSVAFGEYGCNPNNNTCTKACTGTPCEGREGECQEVVPRVCGYGQPGDELEELTTNGQQCGSNDDCPPKYLNTPLLGCGQL